MVELGKVLFFDPRLSKSHNISCNTCHQIGLGGVDALPTSIGHKAQKGSRNAPTVFNSVFNKAQFWDGRAADLKEQASGPMQNPLEMGMSVEHAIETLKGVPGYAKLFKDAFPSEADPISISNASAAIAAFEGTLLTPNAPFDKYLRGDADALTADQKEGLKLFIDKGCATCHAGINVGGQSYAPFGVVERPGARILPPTRAASWLHIRRAMNMCSVCQRFAMLSSPLRISIAEALGIWGKRFMSWVRASSAKSSPMSRFPRSRTSSSL